MTKVGLGPGPHATTRRYRQLNKRQTNNLSPTRDKIFLVWIRKDQRPLDVRVGYRKSGPLSDRPVTFMFIVCLKQWAIPFPFIVMDDRLPVNVI
jgi:hypothetical protein